MKYHTPYTNPWFQQLEAKNPHQAAFTREIISIAGSETVCAICGDESARDYQCPDEKFKDGTIVTARLCDDCLQIQKNEFGGSFVLI
jgi:hypothetical protein